MFATRVYRLCRYALDLNQKHCFDTLSSRLISLISTGAPNSGSLATTTTSKTHDWRVMFGKIMGLTFQRRFSLTFFHSSVRLAPIFAL
jgi:hypothetical protein